MGGQTAIIDSFTTFGDLLKYLRVRAQLSQRDLSIAVGYSEAQISRQENNKRVPSENTILALYVPALGLENEPDVLTRMLTLATKARGEAAQQGNERAQLAFAVREPFYWADDRKSNLPLPLSSFIGREQEITGVCQNVLQHRLFTLTGAGGVGKTRLAMRAAEEMLAYFADGIWLVELAPVSDSALVARAVARALEVQEQPGQDLPQTLVRVLRSRSLLLILDNCEHVIDGAASLAVQLLQGCPHLHILATSRELLGVEGELAFRCPSLTLPKETPLPSVMPLPSVTPMQGTVDHQTHAQPYLDEVGQSEAVRLFVERAQTAWPEFQLSEANALAVVQVCRRLDGIPLAIELAAARTRILTVEQIAARLDNAFGLLAGGRRQALPRHQTLKALIDWSYHLLAQEERILLQRLSIFAGGWTLEAAEQVCADRLEEPAGTGPVPIDREQVIELLGRLVDKSMVQFEPSEGDEPRYRILETVRQYAHELLVSSGSAPEIRERHLDHFLSLALQAEPHLRAWGSNDWLNRLERELDNIRQALDWSVSGLSDSARLVKGLQFAASLYWFWWTRNYASDGTRWLERLLAEQTRWGDPRALDTEGRVARGRAMNVLSLLILECQGGGIPFSKGSSAEALYKESQVIFQKLCDELGDAYRRDYALARFIETEHQGKTEQGYLACRELFQAANDRFWESECEKELAGFYTEVLQNPEKAISACERSLAIKQEIGDLDGQANIFDMVSFCRLLLGSEQRSIDLKTLAIKTMDQAGNRLFAANLRCDLAGFFILRGNVAEAASLLAVASRLARTLHVPSITMYCEMIRGYLALEKGEYEQAVQACESVIAMNEDFPFRGIMNIFYILARVAISSGEVCQAKAALKDMLDHNPFVDGQTRLRMMHGLGLLSVQEGQWVRAATWLGARDAMCAQSYWASHYFSPMERSAFDQARAASRNALGEEAFSAGWEAGQAMSEEQIRNLAKESLL